MKRVIRAWYGVVREQIAKVERLRAKRREQNRNKKIKNHAARNQVDGVDGAVAADGAGDGAVAPMSLDGAAVADGAADGAVAPVSLEKREAEARSSGTPVVGLD